MSWELKQFKDVVEFPPKITLEKGEPYSFIPMEELNSGVKYVAPKNEKNWNGSGGAKFEEGDTLFARITPCLQNGKISQAKNLKNGKGFGSTEYFIFRGINNLTDSDFIYYFTLNEEFKQYAIGSMVGASGRQRADAKFVGEYEINLPPLQTQKRIASILSNYDDLIENNLKRIKLLEETAQNIYKEWFVNFRFPNYENTAFDKESGLPVGWNVKKLNDIFSIKYGKNLPTTKIKTEGKYKVYGASGIMGYYEASNTNLKVALITSRGNGSGEIHRTYENESFVTNNSFVVIPKETFEYIPFYYTIELLKTLNLKNYCSGSAQPQLTNNSMNNIDFLLPKTKSIKLFENTCSSIYEQIDLLLIQNQKLKEARDILLPRLMNRTIEV